MNIAFLGLGSMNGAILHGLQQAGIRSQNLCATCNSAESARSAADKYGITVYSSAEDAAANAKAVQNADVIIVGVKPAQVTGVLESIKSELGPKTIVVSVAAAVTVDQMEAALNPEQPVVRTMPNTPTQVGAGVIGLCPGNKTSPEQLATVKDLLDQAAHTVVVDETKMDALTGVSGSGPAYIFHFAETLIEAGVKAGLDQATAHELAIGTIAGAAKMLQQENADPAALRVAVTSPNGTTEAALRKLIPLGGLVEEAVLAARDRAAEISAELG